MAEVGGSIETVAGRHAARTRRGSKEGHAHARANKAAPRRWLERLFSPIDIAPLVFFRIAFASLLVIDLCGKALEGTIQRNLVELTFRFRYYGFGWLPVPPGNWMYLLVGLAVLSALGVALGLFYRVSSIVLFATISWYFLLEQSTYLNHYYLVCLLAFLMMFLPAHRSYSLDVLRKPGLRSEVAPAWTVWLLCFQMGVVYFFGGLAKINGDWLHGEPVRSWMHNRIETHPLGPMLATEPAVHIIAWGGMLFDLLVVPLLLWRRTRVAAFCGVLFFHLANATIFNIGIFPMLSLAATLLFFPPSLHRRIIEWFKGSSAPRSKQSASAAVNLGASKSFEPRPWVLAGLAAYCAYQLLMPLRHVLYPGPASWTEEGHRFAWHMMLRQKLHTAEFFVLHRDPALPRPYVWKVDTAQYLSERQADKMGSRPDMIQQFARQLRDRLLVEGHKEVSVHALVYAQLNKRPTAMLIDPQVDLASVPRSLRTSSWILPIQNNVTPPAWFRGAKSAPPPVPEGPAAGGSPEGGSAGKFPEKNPAEVGTPAG